METELQKNKQLPELNFQEQVSQILGHESNINESFEFSEILERLQEVLPDEELVDDFGYQIEANEEQEDLLNMAFILENTESITEDNELENTLIEPPIINSIPLFISKYPTILIEKKNGIRASSIPKLSFPQLSVCYFFDYEKYISEKKISYSVLSSHKTKLLIPVSQIKENQKLLNSKVKEAIPQNETVCKDLITRSRVLLLKSQLTIQKKQVPESINNLSKKFLETRRKRKANEMEEEQEQ